MIKQIKWPLWLIILFLLLLLSIIFGKLTEEINKYAHNDALSVQINSKQINTGIKLQTETKEANSFTSFVTYPYTKIEAIDLPIREWVIEQEKLFYDEMEQTGMILSENIEAHFNLQTEVFKVNDNIFSIVMTAEQFANSINEYSFLHTFTIDLSKENIVESTDIMNVDDSDADDIYKIMKESITDEQITENIDKKRFKKHLQNFDHIKLAINGENISFYFNPTDIGSFNKVIKVEVPIIQIHNYISEDFKPILITEEMAEKINSQPRKLDPNGKYIALTFDDGPNEKVTPKILKTLKKYNAKATFFMLGQNAKAYPELAKQVAIDGHEVANHTFSHANLNAVKAKRIKKEVNDSIVQIEKATAVNPKIFRPPYGEFNQTVIKEAEKSNQSIIMWSVDTLDWKYRNAKSVFKRAKSARSGSIVLMHDIHPTTADALPQILKYLSDQGFEFVTVSELLPLIEGEGVGPYYGN